MTEKTGIGCLVIEGLKTSKKEWSGKRKSIAVKEEIAEFALGFFGMEGAKGDICLRG